jgi:hypothetical protein
MAAVGRIATCYAVECIQLKVTCLYPIASVLSCLCQRRPRIKCILSESVKNICKILNIHIFRSICSSFYHGESKLYSNICTEDKGSLLLNLPANFTEKISVTQPKTKWATFIYVGRQTNFITKLLKNTNVNIA